MQNLPEWFNDLFGLLKRDEPVKIPKEELKKYVEDLNSKLSTATGAERTRIMYSIANSLVFLNQTLDDKKRKGKWVFIED